MPDAKESSVNEFERRRWNDDYWVSAWPAREQLTNCATAALLALASPSAGERVLDVGSGCGATALLAAAAVGAEGAVVGADISEVLVATARATAKEAGEGTATFVLADAQYEPLPGGPFDLVMSRFGVMFFEHPEVAFENLRRHSSPGARLAFACWQPASENPWFLGHAIGDLVPKPAPPAPGSHVTGPFAFSDPDDVTRILEAAGWTAVRFDEHRETVVVDRAAIADHGQAAFQGVEPAQLDAAIEAIDRHASRFERDDGRLDVPVAYFVVGAQAAG